MEEKVWKPTTAVVGTSQPASRPQTARKQLYGCSACPSTFVDEASFLQHLHNQECTGTFPQVDAPPRPHSQPLHQNIHQLAPVQHSYACSFCSFTFSSYNQLQYHSAVAHPQPSFSDLPVYEMAAAQVHQAQHPQAHRHAIPYMKPSHISQHQHPRQVFRSAPDSRPPSQGPSNPQRGHGPPRAQSLTKPGTTQLLYNGNYWTILAETSENYEDLRKLRHSKEELVFNGHVLEKLTAMEVNSRRKCKVCKVGFSVSVANSDCKMHVGRLAYDTGKGLFTCCGQAKTTKGCVVREAFHIFDSYEHVEAANSYLPTPPLNPYAPKRKAVVIDCEMGRAHDNSLELIQIVAIDYFTAEVLINKIVRPRGQIKDFNTAYSGITPQIFHSNIQAGNFIDGWVGARVELNRWIDSETILIGHSIKNDLAQLRVIHHAIVDSSIAIPRIKAEGHSLKSLCQSLLYKKVQQVSNKKPGHDCLEDTLATRELIIWCTNNASIIKLRSEQQRLEMELDALERKEAAAQKLQRDTLKRQVHERHAAAKAAETAAALGTTTPTNTTSSVSSANEVSLKATDLHSPPTSISSASSSVRQRTRRSRGSRGNPQKDGKFVLAEMSMSAKNGRVPVESLGVPTVMVQEPTPVKKAHTATFVGKRAGSTSPRTTAAAVWSIGF